MQLTFVEQVVGDLQTTKRMSMVKISLNFAKSPLKMSTFWLLNSLRKIKLIDNEYILRNLASLF